MCKNDTINKNWQQNRKLKQVCRTTLTSPKTAKSDIYIWATKFALGTETCTFGFVHWLAINHHSDWPALTLYLSNSSFSHYKTIGS